MRPIATGVTTSYRAIVEAIGRPTASRAVGAANGKNPISIVVPCHRVIGSNGMLTGYGSGLDRKAWLLNRETTARSLLAGASSRRTADLRGCATGAQLAGDGAGTAGCAKGASTSLEPKCCQMEHRHRMVVGSALTGRFTGK
jgi:O-6-methylguanine DNA methyltransferase